jgi:site-specific recombinase XerD
MDIQKAIRDYVELHEIENHSKWTVLRLHEHLTWFAEWLESAHHITDTTDLRIAHLRGWAAYLQSRPMMRGSGTLSDRSIHVYCQAMLAFCHWLEYEEVIEKPITTRFKLPHVEKTFIPTFTPEDVEKLFVACDAGKRYTPQLRKALTARNRAIVSILIDTGIRRQELVGLRLCDVDRDLRVLLVHRKGNKWQQVPVSYEGFKPLHEYLSKYRSPLAVLDGRSVARKEDAVFLADNGKPFTIEGVSKLFQRLADRAGIEDKRVSPHQCRRYMATSQLAAGRSPLDVQRQLGHTTLMMTNHYASLDIQQLKRSHEAYSPLRAKQENIHTHGSGIGYWEEE